MIAEPRPAILVANQRTGGTLLSYCLSNHPDIFSERGEVLHRDNLQRSATPKRPAKIVHAALSHQFYAVSMCKLTYNHLLRKGVWNYLTSRKQELYVIWLIRRNVLEQYVSQKLMEPGRVHSENPVAAKQITLSREAADKGIARIKRENRQIGQRIAGTFDKVLKITYEEVTGGGGEVSSLPAPIADKICNFLEVPNSEVDLAVQLRKINKAPLSEIVTWS